MESIKEIKQTTDYKMFKILKGNRGISPARVNKIKKSIEDVGYITSPIIVNENMEVIDGQGRLQALQELKLPVEYIVQNGLSIRHCVSMNINQTNWNVKDYVKSYADRGVKSYVSLNNLMDEFYKINDISIFAAAAKQISTFDPYAIKNGDFVLTDEEVETAKENLNYIYDLYTKYKKIPRIIFIVKAMILCTDISGIDLKRLKERAVEYLDYGKIPPIPTTDEAMQFLEEIYNKYKTGTNFLYIYTEYRKILAEKQRKIAEKGLKAALDARAKAKELKGE